MMSCALIKGRMLSMNTLCGTGLADSCRSPNSAP